MEKGVRESKRSGMESKRGGNKESAGRRKRGKEEGRECVRKWRKTWINLY